MNVESVDLITKFFNVFQSLSIEDQKKALLVVEGMSISKRSETPVTSAIFSADGTGVPQEERNHARVPQKQQCKGEVV